MMGVMRWGMPAYGASSTRFGSINTMRTSAGVALISSETIIEFTKLDLPDPVAPATKRWGIFARLATTNPPSTSLPRPMVIGCWLLVLALDRRTSPSETISRSTFGISIPIALLPGMGDRMRTSLLATAYERFLLSAVTRSTLTLGPNSIS